MSHKDFNFAVEDARWVRVLWPTTTKNAPRNPKALKVVKRFSCFMEETLVSRENLGDKQFVEGQSNNRLIVYLQPEEKVEQKDCSDARVEEYSKRSR